MADERLLAFRFDCGAPWLNLLATRGRAFGGRPVERLYSPARLTEWLARGELAPARAADRSDLERARELRETLRALALPTVAGDPPPADAAAALTGFLAAHDDPVRLATGDRLTRPAPATATAALARVARQAVDHLTGPGRHTLKTCPELDCRAVFADTTDRRRWCPSPACASRGRVRALRARRGDGPASPPAR
ncbi:CGNR zinc finger domain-containing protein [Streptomyces specialis]|uniref:CGNR zinc finger domain-containing protein n=1 Tax=Streptomyces specialis TaxID=498367 RepID=UPI00073EFB61|nr:CGNR zinc finger domain-containing protein [Streptomyces specialis]